MHEKRRANPKITRRKKQRVMHGKWHLDKVWLELGHQYFSQNAQFLEHCFLRTSALKVVQQIQLQKQLYMQKPWHFINSHYPIFISLEMHFLSNKRVIYFKDSNLLFTIYKLS